MNFPAYKDLYDFAKIEQAIQSYFVSTGIFVAPPSENDTDREEWSAGADAVAVFTAFESAIFEKSRPRVAIFLSGINPLNHMIADNNGALRNNAWRGTLTLEVITAPSYTAHSDLRAMVQAVGEMIAPHVSNAAALIGANQYLTNHQINYVLPQNVDTSINIGEGFYGSQLTYQITFSVPAGAILAVAE